MRSNLYLPLLLIFILLSSFADGQKKGKTDLILFEINGDPTYADEFIYVYEKNNFNNDNIYTAKDIDDYFDLFLNFKLKVEAAKSLGMDTTQAFLEEYEGYKDQLIKPWLIETKEQDRLVKEAYERMQYEVDASHILITVAPDALPEDTAKAYQKITEVYEKAKGGQAFGELAMQYSEDPSAKTNMGRLGYFTALQMVFPFEEAAYNTPKDSVSEIIRSQFGYHLLKVHDRRPSSGQVKVSHIMVQTKGDNAGEEKKINEIYGQLIAGADWDDLCRKYSDDQRTKNEGGTLPFIGLRQINDEAFEAAAFGLQNPGEISKPVHSRFGWHIIKLEEKKDIDSFEKTKEELEQRISKDERSKLSKHAVVSKLKEQNNFRENTKAKDKLILSADSALLLGNWDIQISDESEKEIFFSINKQDYSTADVVTEIKQKLRRRNGISPQNYMNELIDDFIETSLTDYEEKQLVANNRDFRMLLNEYHEGILLFEIMNNMVWGKAVSDTAGLKQYFNDHQQNYIRDTSADAIIVSSRELSVLTNIKKLIHDDSVKLSEIAFNSKQVFDAEVKGALDSMIKLYGRYDESTVTLYADEHGVQSVLYKNILSFLQDNKVKVETVGLPESADNKDEITAVLNSKSKKSLEYLYNTESALTLQVTEGQFEKGALPTIDSLVWEKGVFEFKDNDTYYLVYINEILGPRPENLKDIRGTVISDYQNYLEKVWIEELKNKNEIVINKKTLDKIKKTYKKKLAAAD